MYFVTGATGFIGRHLVESLVADGLRVRCLVRGTKGSGAVPRSEIKIAHGDLSDPAALDKALAGAKTVLHLAATVKALSLKDFFLVNAHGTANLMRVAEARGVERVIYVSSISAVGPSLAGLPLDERTVPHPIDSYGRSKLAGEEQIRRSRLSDRSVIVRPSGVYGPGDLQLLHFFRAVNRGRIPVVSSRASRFHLIYVSDLVKGIRAAAATQGALGQTLYLTHPASISWSELGYLAAAEMERKALPIKVPRTLAMGVAGASEIWARLTSNPTSLTRDQIRESSSEWLVNGTFSDQLIGLSAATNLSDGLRITLRSYREAGLLRF